MIERTFIEQGMKKIQLEQYMKKQLDRAGFTGLHIVKTPLVTRIVLTVARPGLAIGKGGQNIRNIEFFCYLPCKADLFPIYAMNYCRLKCRNPIQKHISILSPKKGHLAGRMRNDFDCRRKYC